MFLKFAARWALIGALLAAALPVRAQFTSGSNGTDGPLDYSTQPPGTTIVFTPSTFGHTAATPVYNFTTINIPTGVVVRLSGTLIAGPVIWLASSTVQIAGTIDLSGSIGSCESPTECRTPSVPGAGGYPGGVGGTGSADPPEPGLGPGGGAAGTATTLPAGGTFTGNSLLIPLVGGSGGGGTWAGGGGGAGGGALFIASSVSINLSGRINAYGGNDGYGTGAGGSGGAIRLAAPTIGGNGVLAVYGGSGINGPANGTNGIARVESFNGWSFGLVSGAGSENVAAPYSTFVSTQAPPTITITSVNNFPVMQPPTGSFQTPDVQINAAGSVQVTIQATNVPVGSTVNLQFYSDNGPDIFQSTPLAGTLASSTATANVIFPTGYTRGLAYVTFTGPAPQIVKPPTQ